MSTKKYIYNIGEFSGARLKYEISILNKYKKINIDGFKITENGYSYIVFTIDDQLFRRLKLKKINDDVKVDSIDDRILKLLENSKRLTNIDDDTSRQYVLYNYRVSDYEYDYASFLKEYKRDQKRYNKYQSKIISQKTNRLSKKGFKK